LIKSSIALPISWKFYLIALASTIIIVIVEEVLVRERGVVVVLPVVPSIALTVEVFKVSLFG